MDRKTPEPDRILNERPFSLRTTTAREIYWPFSFILCKKIDTRPFRFQDLYHILNETPKEQKTKGISAIKNIFPRNHHHVVIQYQYITLNPTLSTSKISQKPYSSSPLLRRGRPPFLLTGLPFGPSFGGRRFGLGLSSSSSSSPS